MNPCHLLRAAVLAAAFSFVPLVHAQPAPAPKPQRPTPQDIEKITAALPEKAPATPKQARKLLVFTRATGFVHSSIPVGAKTFELMGNKTGAFTVAVADDPDVFMPDSLKAYDAVLMMSTTGSLFVPKDAKESLLYDPKAKELPADLKHAKELRESLVSFVKSGKGLMGIHAATDSSYGWKEYGLMMGGYFNSHPWGKITLYIDDPNSPINACFAGGKPFEISDEIYRFKEPYSRDRMHVLTSIDVEASKLSTGLEARNDHDYGVSWLNKFGDGRVFYCSLGHSENTYMNPTVLKHYLAGLQFVFGDLDADASPSGPFPADRTAAGQRLAALAWQNVNNGEKWYQDQKAAKEQTFTGMLEAAPAPQGATALQRTALYKLDGKSVFTGGKKVKALDALVGQKVEARGKAVKMELEGQNLDETWIAQVRPAK